MKKPKKILLDLERLRYPNSGIATAFRYLTKGLEKTNPNLHIELYGCPASFSTDFSIFTIKERKIWHKIVTPFVSNYAVIHVSHQLSSYFWNNNKKAIKIVTVHDLNFLYEDISDAKRNRLINLFNKNIRYADYIVCISNFVEQDFKKNKELFTLNKLKETTVIYNGLNFQALDQVYDLPFKILANRKYILNIGVLFSKKNQLSLIRMLPFLEEDLVLVSSSINTAYKKEIEAEIVKLNLTDRVHFFENISNEEKFALLQHCEALCHPSLAEGFGIPPIEAMYYGKPTFLSTFTSLTEIGGKKAFYFNSFAPEEMANCYKTGMAKYKATPSLKEEIINWASQFSYQATAERHIALYNKILSEQ